MRFARGSGRRLNRVVVVVVVAETPLGVHRFDALVRLELETHKDVRVGKVFCVVVVCGYVSGGVIVVGVVDRGWEGWLLLRTFGAALAFGRRGITGNRRRGV